LLALLALGALPILASCGSEGAGQTPTAGAGTRVYRNAPFGFRFDYPRAFSARAFHRDYGMISLDGAVVTNASARGSGIAPYTPALSKLPARSVVFLVQQLNGGPAPALEEKEAHFPLRTASFAPVRGVTLPKGASWREYGFSANGWNLVADVYFGARASKADRVATWRIVSSLRFKSLRTGQLTASRFQVLKMERRYSVGSVERLNGDDFLVRAPHGFYGIGGLAWTNASPVPCPIRFERAKFEFACANGSRHWNRVGRPLWKGASFRDYLGVLVAVKVGQDGHVLFSPNMVGSGSPALERKYWGSAAS
jgi:hypothetical protein